MEKILVVGKTDLWSEVVLTQLYGAIHCIICSLKSPVLLESYYNEFKQ